MCHYSKPENLIGTSSLGTHASDLSESTQAELTIRMSLAALLSGCGCLPLQLPLVHPRISQVQATSPSYSLYLRLHWSLAWSQRNSNTAPPPCLHLHTSSVPLVYKVVMLFTSAIASAVSTIQGFVWSLNGSVRWIRNFVLGGLIKVYYKQPFC